jgi:predicted nucleic acid-binding protein
MIVLDTDVMIDLLRRYQPAIAWLNSLSNEEIILPGFVIMELIQGCRNKEEQERVERELQSYRVAWPSPETCATALSVFASVLSQKFDYKSGQCSPEFRQQSWSKRKAWDAGW